MHIIHIGDIHLYRLGLKPWDMIGKRTLGQGNLWLKRRHRINKGAIRNLVNRVHDLDPDLILFSGDLTVTALPEEFEDVKKELQLILNRFQCVMVPGNHDRYTYTSQRKHRFEYYFDKHTFPFWPGVVRLDDDLVLMALDPTRPNKFNASGRLGEEQLHRIRDAMTFLKEDDRLIVLCHYDLGDPPGFKQYPMAHGLLDRQNLIDLLPEHRGILYLHGHVHHPWIWKYGGDKWITDLNAGACIMTDHGWEHTQGFWEIIVEDGQEQPWYFIHHHPDAEGNWVEVEVDAPKSGAVVEPR